MTYAKFSPPTKNIKLTSLLLAIFLGGCSFWDPLDHDTYTSRADASVEVAGKTYPVTWTPSIYRKSSFNPYDKNGRQDGWCIEPNGTTLTLPDGKMLWIDGAHSVPTPEKVLGITGAQPVGYHGPIKTALNASHSVKVSAPLYWIKQPIDQTVEAKLCDKCTVEIEYTVPAEYVGPSENERLNFYDNHCGSENDPIARAIYKAQKMAN